MAFVSRQQQLSPPRSDGGFFIRLTAAWLTFSVMLRVSTLNDAPATSEG